MFSRSSFLALCAASLVASSLFSAPARAENRCAWDSFRGPVCFTIATGGQIAAPSSGPMMSRQ